MAEGSPSTPHFTEYGTERYTSGMKPAFPAQSCRECQLGSRALPIWSMTLSVENAALLLHCRLLQRMCAVTACHDSKDAHHWVMSLADPDACSGVQPGGHQRSTEHRPVHFGDLREHPGPRPCAEFSPQASLQPWHCIFGSSRTIYHHW